MIILGTNSIKATGFDVANSLRFNKGDDPELSRSTGDGNERIGMFSFWTKTDDEGVIYEITTDSNNFFDISVDGSRQLQVRNKLSGSYNMELLLTRQFRDPSAWTHFFIAIDTTQGTNTNRAKLYVNGVQETSFSTATYPDQNADLFMNANSKTAKISGTSGVRFNGYLAEFVLIDGTVKAVTDFGEFDSDSGIWKPINVSGLSGDKGVNGFYLDFEDSSALGNCAFGGTDFTVSNLAAIDQSTDTCTNNGATVSPLVVIGNTGQTYADGNLTFNPSGNNWTATHSTIGASNGKWYAEFKVVTLASSSGYGNVGIIGTEGITVGNFVSTDDNSVGVTLDHRGSGQTNLYSAGSSVQAAGVAFAAGAIVGMAVDMDNKKFYFSQNGTYLTVSSAVGDPTSGSTGTGALTIPAGIETFLFAVGGYSTSFKGTWNFGSPPYAISSGNQDGNGFGNFEYAVPSGYFALNTKNLAEHG